MQCRKEFGQEAEPDRLILNSFRLKIIFLALYSIDASIDEKQIIQYGLTNMLQK